MKFSFDEKVSRKVSIQNPNIKTTQLNSKIQSVGESSNSTPISSDTDENYDIYNDDKSSI